MSKERSFPNPITSLNPVKLHRLIVFVNKIYGITVFKKVKKKENIAIFLLILFIFFYNFLVFIISFLQFLNYISNGNIARLMEIFDEPVSPTISYEDDLGS